MISSSQNHMKITIIGSGAMASMLGAKLNPLGKVILVGHWPEQVASLQQGSLLVEEANDRYLVKLHITNNPAGLARADLVLILVKSHQTAAAAQMAGPLVADQGLVLTLQNGLGNKEALTAVLGPNKVAAGITSAGAAMVAPGHVRIAGSGQTFLALNTGQASRLEKVADLFQQAGLPTALTENPDRLIWGKLAVNAGINPLTAILGKPNGYLTENEIACALMKRAAYEVTAVAAALGITPLVADAGEQALQVAAATAGNRSSMLQDIDRGAPTEIEAICGAVVNHGRLHHIPTPVNLAFFRCLKKIEADEWQVAATPETTLSYLQSLISNLEETS